MPKLHVTRVGYQIDSRGTRQLNRMETNAVGQHRNRRVVCQEPAPKQNCVQNFDETQKLRCHQEPFHLLCCVSNF